MRGFNQLGNGTFFFFMSPLNKIQSNQPETNKQSMIKGFLISGKTKKKTNSTVGEGQYWRDKREGERGEERGRIEGNSEPEQAERGSRWCCLFGVWYGETAEVCGPPDSRIFSLLAQLEFAKMRTTTALILTNERLTHAMRVQHAYVRACVHACVRVDAAAFVHNQSKGG